MVLLKIYKLEDTDEKEPISDLSCGEHIIGRGALLQCNDKRVSRKHAVINVGEEKATITSVHVNPCYYMSSQGKNMIILPKDEPVDLNDNDKFALLTDLYWFKVKLLMEEAEQNGDGSRTPSPDQLFSKRAADLDEAGTSKRIRLSFDEDNAVNDETHASDESLDLMTAGENQVTPVKEVKEEDIENNITVKEEISSQNNIIKEENDQDREEIKQEASQHINDTVKDEPQTSQDPPAVNQPSTSNPRRERCWYGANCFRKNPTHKTDFSHPGDDDYNSDPNDDRPFCPYGLACYRKNRDHRRDYRHSAANVPPPRGGNDQPKPKPKRKAAKKTATTADYDDDSEDDYDYDDPFLDDSGDEYQVSSDEDSDWGDSQSQSQQESEETTKLLKKEAKKFTKGL